MRKQYVEFRCPCGASLYGVEYPATRFEPGYGEYPDGCEECGRDFDEAKYVGYAEPDV